MTDTVVLELGTGRSKGEIVERAFAVIGIASENLDSDMLVKGLSTLNVMMMEAPWNALGFNLPTYGEGDLADFSELLDAYIPAVVHGLAMLLAAEFGKTLSTEAAARVRTTRRNLDALLAASPALKMRAGVPLGVGRRDFASRVPLYSSNS